MKNTAVKNTTSKLLMSAAAFALFAGVGMAYAQVPAPATQQTAPAEKMAPADNNGAVKGKTPAVRRTIGQTEDRMERKGGKAEHARDNAKDDMNTRGNRSQSRTSGTSSRDKNVDNKNIDDKSRAETKSGINGDGRTTQKSGSNNARTQAAAPGSERLSSEQRTTIRSVVNRHNVKPAANVNFAISIGTAVPRSVHFNRVPVELVHIYPHWRGYDYFLVGDQIVVVNPRTHKIVAVLDA